MPAALTGVARILPRLAESSRSGTVIVAVSELRAITTRSIALAAIAGLAVYGSVAIGGARDDLLSGIDMAISQYHSTADVWVTTGSDVFNTDSFAVGAGSGEDPPGPRGTLGTRLSGDSGGCGQASPVGTRTIARGSSMLESSQIVQAAILLAPMR